MKIKSTLSRGSLLKLIKSFLENRYKLLKVYFTSILIPCLNWQHTISNYIDQFGHIRGKYLNTLCIFFINGKLKNSPPIFTSQLLEFLFVTLASFYQKCVAKSDRLVKPGVFFLFTWRLTFARLYSPPDRTFSLALFLPVFKFASRKC